MQANTFAAGLLGRALKPGADRTWRTCIIGLVLAGLAASASASVTIITGVNIANKPDRVLATVTGSEPLRMSVLQSKTGSYLGFQFAGRLVVKGGLVSINSGRIFNIRYSRFAENPPLTRVVFNTTCHLDYSTQWNADKTRVEITVWKFGANRAQRTAPQAQAQTAAQPAQNSLPALPTAAIGGAQGSDTAEAADPSSVKVTPVPAAKLPGSVARIAPPAPPTRIAQAFVTPASSGAGKKVCLNFLGADINDVLKALSVQSGENIVVGSDVTGTITVTLDAVTVEEALDYITQLTGYHYIKDQHTYLVGSTGTVGGLVDPKVEIVTLAYANADDVLEMLKVQCPQVRSTKISVRGGTARVHKQELHQGTAAESGAGAAVAGAGAAAAAAGQPSAAAPGETGAPPQPAAAAKATEGGGTTAGDALKQKQVQDITESVAPQSEKSPTSNMIALVGSAEKVAAAKEFVAKVEEAMRDQAADKKVAIYQVKYVNTWELANTLMSLVLGVNIALGPSDESGPLTPQQTPSNVIRNVPANLLSGEDTHRPFYDYQNTSATVPTSRTLIIVGLAQDVQKALDTAARFDVPGETDLAAYKVKYVDVNTLAGAVRRLVPGATVTGLDVTDTSTGAGAGAGAGTNQSAQGNQTVQGGQGTQATTMNATAVNNLSRIIVVTGRKGDVEKAKGLLEALDIKSPQIKIEAKITSLTETGEKKLGLSWSWDDFTKKEVSPSHWERQPWNFAATLDALITTGEGKLLAAPSLVCLEGKPGQFFVGDQIRFITQISAAANGVTTVTTDTANVGVQLSVVGTVSSEGDITLNLHPEVSVVKLEEVTAPGVALTLPTITRRYTDHVVRVRNGDTIVIGGLISDNDLDTIKRIPVLGDLPVLGHLFRHREKTKDHSEVVIFITASIVND
jgi:type II secretory pathway component GspD/PulD (secretin)